MCCGKNHKSVPVATVAAAAVAVAVGGGVVWLVTATPFVAVAMSVVSAACVAITVRIVRELRHPSLGPLWRPARAVKAVPVRVRALPARAPLAIEAPKPVLTGVVVERELARVTGEQEG